MVGHKGGGAELDHRVGGGGVGSGHSGGVGGGCVGFGHSGGDGQGGNSGKFWWGRTDRVDFRFVGACFPKSRFVGACFPRMLFYIMVEEGESFKFGIKRNRFLLIVRFSHKCIFTVKWVSGK